jgi:riboflavin kinase / FMN adenylyltransferase
MRIIRDFASCPPEYKGCVVALGNFDGVHIGHQAILKETLSQAKHYGVPAAVMTFEPHPREFFDKERKKLRISSFKHKIACFEKAGIDIMFLVRFNRSFASLSPTDFVGDVLCDHVGARHVVTGYNFAFGKGRMGDIAFLHQEAASREFGYTACAAVGDNVSSSAIRTLLSQGSVTEVSALLGRPYSIEGTVRHGQKNGRKLGFPTANLSLKNLYVPRYGVYAVRFHVKHESKHYDGVANIGIRPTFNLNEPLLEVHGFDMNQDLYGKHITVEFVKCLRDEQPFENVEMLKSQITKDCEQARKTFHAHA